MAFIIVILQHFLVLTPHKPQLHIMIVAIGPHFSKDIRQHRPVDVTFSLNPAANYLTSILMQREASSIVNTTERQFRAKALAGLNSGVNQMHNAAHHLEMGASQLSQGASRAVAQGPTLTEGTQKLVVAAQQVNRAMTSLTLGTANLKDAMDQWGAGVFQWTQASGGLANAGQTLASNQQKLLQAVISEGSSMSHLSQSVSTIGLNAEHLSQYAPSLQTIAAEDVVASHNLQRLIQEAQASSSPSVLTALQSAAQRQSVLANALQQQSQVMATGVANLAAGTQQIAASDSQISTAIARTTTTSQSLAPSIGQWQRSLGLWQQKGMPLSQGSAKMALGLQSLTSGEIVLNQHMTGFEKSLNAWAGGFGRYREGIGRLSSAIQGMTQGIKSLANGSGQLYGPLQVFAHPPKGQIHSPSKGNYGTGMVPYFVGLSLWVGAVVATVLVPGGRWRKTAVRSRLGQSMAIAVGQAILLGLGTAFILPIHPLHLWAYAGVIVGISVVWWAVVRFLVEKFGDAGRIVGIVLLVIQLAGSGGTYPVILSPVFFQTIHPYLPMTWAIHLFRWALEGAYSSRIMWDSGYLATLGGVSWGLTRWWSGQVLFEAPILNDGDAKDSTLAASEAFVLH